MAVRTCCLVFPAVCHHIGEFGRVPVGLASAETVALLKSRSARHKGMVERGGIRPE